MKAIESRRTRILVMLFFMLFMPNAQTEPRSWLARSVLLGAQSVTAMIVGSSALFGSVFHFIVMGSDTAGLDSDWLFMAFYGFEFEHLLDVPQ